LDGVTIVVDRDPISCENLLDLAMAYAELWVGVMLRVHPEPVLMEVFRAHTLPSLDAAFYGRLLSPRSNPARRKTFALTG
jgi:hypothetical protein